MNALLWVTQVLLALLNFTGGSYKVSHPAELAAQVDAISALGFRALGVFEVLGAVLLIVPAATHWMPALTPLAAALLTLETLGLSALFAQSSLKLSLSNPLVWSATMALLSAFVAYGRFALRPV